MKKKTFYFALIAAIIPICLSGCNNKANDSDEYNSETDYQYVFHEQNHRVQTTASKNGYYFLNANYMYYADKNTMKPVLLDNRPNADCDDTKIDEKPNCRAYFNIPSDNGFLEYQNGKLYTLRLKPGFEKENSQKTELIEVSLDGAKRKEIMTFDFPPHAIAIHRGVVYYSTSSYTKQSELNYQIMKYDLNGGIFSKPQAIYTGSLEAGHILDIIPYRSNVYFFESGKNMYRTMRYDLKTSNISPMFENADNGNAIISGIAGDKLYFSYFYGDENDSRSTVQYSSDLEGKQIEVVPIKRNFLTHLYASGSFLYARPVWFYLNREENKHIADEMTVYDQKYQVIDKFNLSYLPLAHSLNPGDERYMFARFSKDGAEHLQILDKSDIGSGNAAFKPFIETKYH